jgi:hypothetical protein
VCNYPKRPSHFAHRFCRLMTKVAVANEIGPDACWMLTVIVHQEDARRYRGPVTFYSEQLMPLCGFNSRGRLIRARQRAVEAGWLVYEQGSRGKPAKYFVAIPGEFSGVDDTPVDESVETENEPTICSKLEQNPDRMRAQSVQNGHDAPALRSNLEQNASAIRTESEQNPDRIRAQSGALSTLYPNPTPNPVPEGEDTTRNASAPSPDLSAVVDAWNSLGPPFPSVRGLSEKRRRALRSRLADPDWRSSWRDALARLPTSRFLRGENDRGWRANIDWFLRPDSVTKILEGQYDDPVRGSPTRRTAAATYDRTLEGLEAFIARGEACDTA